MSEVETQRGQDCVEALARVLHRQTDGEHGEGTATWDDPAHREVYALAVEEVATAILADPGPLLATLAEAGVLTEVYSLARQDPQPRMDGPRVQHAGESPDRSVMERVAGLPHSESRWVERRYVTEWEDQP